VELTRNDEKDFWRDNQGTIYAYSEPSWSVDSSNNCGVGVFSLADNDPRNLACSAHDFEYSSPVYQAFHTRSEADEELEKRLTVEGYPESGEFFSLIAKVLGSQYWENKETDK
jgi:hypothetical protein